MKRALTILLALLLLVSCCACGAKSEGTAAAPAAAVEDKTEQKPKEEEPVTEQPAEQDTDTIECRIACTSPDLYVSMPDYRAVEVPGADVYIKYDVHFFTTMATDPALFEAEINNNEEAFEFSFPLFQDSVDRYVSIEETRLTSEERTVSGIDTLYYSGTVTCVETDSGEAFLAAYVFRWNGVCVLIAGVVLDPAQSQALITETAETLDAVMASIHEK